MVVGKIRCEGLRVGMAPLVAVLFAALGACTGNGSLPGDSAALPEGSPEALVVAILGSPPKPDRTEAEITRYPLGSKDNPVRVGGPAGERAYLARLRCEDGRPPGFERDGSMGPGPWGYILDAYTVTCTDGRASVVYMDMYHSRHKEALAVPGFSIEPIPAE